MSEEAFLARPDLGSIMQYHIVLGVYRPERFADGATFETLEGSTISVSVRGEQPYLNGDIAITYALPQIVAGEEIYSGWGGHKTNGDYIVVDDVLFLPEVTE